MTNLMAVQNGDRDEIKFFGHLNTFSFPEVGVTPAELEEAFRVSGLDRKWMPGPRNPRDAFRSAVDREVIKHLALGNGRFLNLITAQLSKSSDPVLTFSIIRQVVDEDNKKLEPHTEISRIVHASETVLVMPVLPLDQISDAEQRAFQDIQDRYEWEKTHYTNVHIRDALMRVFRDCNPIGLRAGGGVYFTLVKYESIVNTVKALVKELEPLYGTDTPARFWTIPVIDAAEQRLMVQENMEEQVQGTMKALIKEMADELGNAAKDVTPQKATGFFDRIKEIGDMVTEYEDFLSIKLVTLQKLQTVAEQQAMAVLTKANAARRAAAAVN